LHDHSQSHDLGGPAHIHHDHPPAAPGTDQHGRKRWPPESQRTSTVPTTSRSTPVARR
jgi:hypothetical protein